MKRMICYLFFMSNPILCLDLGLRFDVDEGIEKKEVKEIYEVFTPVNVEERNIVLDITDPEVQEVIRKVVSSSIHEAFKNKQLERELENKRKCCTSSTKLKIALLTAMSSTLTAVVTIILNNK